MLCSGSHWFLFDTNILFFYIWKSQHNGLSIDSIWVALCYCSPKPSRHKQIVYMLNSVKSFFFFLKTVLYSVCQPVWCQPWGPNSCACNSEKCYAQVVYWTFLTQICLHFEYIPTQLGLALILFSCLVLVETLLKHSNNHILYMFSVKN